MCGPVLLILHFHCYDSSGERSPLPLCVITDRKQIGRQWGIKGVCQQDKLELHLFGDIRYIKYISDHLCCMSYILSSIKYKIKHAFFFSSTLIALASLRKMALPQS